MNKQVCALALILVLAGCNKSADNAAPMERSEVFDVKEEAEAAADAAANLAAPATGGGAGGGLISSSTSGGEAPEKPAIPTTVPQIAYSYRHTYSLDNGDVGPVQQRHVALCDKMGVAQCRVASMKRAQGRAAYGTLSLQVNSAKARAFEDELDKVVADEGGEAAGREVNGEDLSKQMIDTAARIKAKQALADRLLILIQRHDGKVADLVEAERAFAEAQEELEAARGTMAEMQGRVAMSSIDITYNPENEYAAQSAPQSHLGDTLGSAGTLFMNSLAALIWFLVAIIPWVLAIWLVVKLLRRRGAMPKLRMPWRKRVEPEEID